MILNSTSHAKMYTVEYGLGSADSEMSWVRGTYLALYV